MITYHREPRGQRHPTQTGAGGTVDVPLRRTDADRRGDPGRRRRSRRAAGAGWGPHLRPPASLTKVYEHRTQPGRRGIGLALVSRIVAPPRTEPSPSDAAVLGGAVFQPCLHCCRRCRLCTGEVEGPIVPGQRRMTTTGRRCGCSFVDDDFAVAAVHRAYLESMPEFTGRGRRRTGLRGAARRGRTRSPTSSCWTSTCPDMSGIEVLRRLRARPGRRLDVIAITAAREVEPCAPRWRAASSHYLIKPFSLAVLTERLPAYLTERREMRRAARRNGADRVDQEQVDRLFSVRQRSHAAPLPKGLSARTLGLASAALAGAGTDLSAAEVGARTGLSRISARRYLEHLVDTGHATVAPRYGTAGRPEHRYRWSDGPPRSTSRQ